MPPDILRVCSSQTHQHLERDVGRERGPGFYQYNQLIAHQQAQIVVHAGSQDRFQRYDFAVCRGNLGVLRMQAPVQLRSVFRVAEQGGKNTVLVVHSLLRIIIWIQGGVQSLSGTEIFAVLFKNVLKVYRNYI